MDPLYQIKIKCACCETTFSTSRVRPSFKKSIRNDSDFCAYFKTVNPDFYVVRVCPYCGFASTESFSDNLSLKQKEAYMEKIGRYWYAKDYGMERTEEEALECYKLCLLTAQTIDESIRIIAGLLHHIAWIYRYREDKEQEKRFLTYALDAYIKVFETERDALSNARLMYLIGELNRRLDRNHEAVRWFGRVINDKKIMDASMIRASREMWQTIREDMTRTGQDLPDEMKETGA